MKKVILSMMILSAAGLMACNKDASKASLAKAPATLSDTTTPACILNKITVLQNQPTQNPPAEVYQYIYNNRKVYYITSDCCDQFNLLYDSACNVLCAPDGGFTGHGDGKCTDFYQTATGKRLIWKDPR
jgi:hypothetical protein